MKKEENTSHAGNLSKEEKTLANRSKKYCVHEICHALMFYKMGYETDEINVKTTLNPLAWAEGIVIRPLTEILDREFTNELDFGGRITFKAINPEFLIKYSE